MIVVAQVSLITIYIGHSPTDIESSNDSVNYIKKQGNFLFDVINTVQSKMFHPPNLCHPRPPFSFSGSSVTIPVV